MTRARSVSGSKTEVAAWRPDVCFAAVSGQSGSIATEVRRPDKPRFSLMATELRTSLMSQSVA
jgi:hypothetical protein